MTPTQSALCKVVELLIKLTLSYQTVDFTKIFLQTTEKNKSVLNVEVFNNYPRNLFVYMLFPSFILIVFCSPELILSLFNKVTTMLQIYSSKDMLGGQNTSFLFFLGTESEGLLSRLK